MTVRAVAASTRMDSRSRTVARAGVPTEHLYVPLTASLAYLGGTFALFLLVGNVSAAPSLIKLTLFILATLAALATGYSLKIRHIRRTEQVTWKPITARETRSAEHWVAVSGLYFGLYGLALLIAYGGKNASEILAAITHPGSAYFSKFSVYEQQLASGIPNPVLQVLTLLSILYTPLVPLTVVYGRRLARGVRYLAYAGAAVYISFFLFIGTLKGIGDLLIFLVASSIVRSFGLSPAQSGKRRSRRAAAWVMLLVGTIFVGYMAFNQSQRLDHVGDRVASEFAPNPLVAAVTGDALAKGISVVAYYPTHGYLGLSYNLDTPFEWSHGRGSSRALDSYWAQYLGGPSQFESTYPARTEARSGWPALQEWATAYPWFASDFTFPGTILLMGILGWWLARTWFEAAFERSRLALLLFCQFVLLIVYIPANNQIGTSRTSLIAFFCLVALYGFNRVNASLARR